MEIRIQQWLKKLHRQRLEPGQIAELEAHLRDTIDELLIKGYSEEEAFTEAEQRVGNLKTIAKQEWNVNGKKERKAMMPAFVPMYFTQAWRQLRRNRVHSMITLSGLILGMTGCLLLAIYVQFERSFDRFHYQPELVYRYMEKSEYSTGTSFSILSPNNLAANIRDELPGVEAVTAVHVFAHTTISSGDLQRVKIRSVIADSAFNRVFQFKMRNGDAMPDLERNEVLLTESAAKRIFGKHDAVGETILWHQGQNSNEMIVRGILADIPGNSHFDFEMTLPYSRVMRHTPILWGGSNGYKTYLRLTEGTQPEHVAQHIHERRLLEAPDHSRSEILLQPLTSIHLYSEASGDFKPNGDVKTILLFAGFSIILLCIACVNHSVLSMALYVRRLKEWGMRKVLGADRKSVFVQLMAECTLILCITIPVALALTALLLPHFGALMARDFGAMFPQFFNMVFLAIAVVAFFVILSGAWPALLLYSNHPMESLRGRLRAGISTGAVQRAAIVAQFAMTAFLMVYLGGVMRQMHYVQTVDLGFNPKNLMSVPVYDWSKSELMAGEIEQMPGVESLSISSWLPGEVNIVSNLRLENDEVVTINRINGDHRFLETTGMQLLAGRTFNPFSTADTSESRLEPWNLDTCETCPIIINEKMAQLLDLGTDFTEQQLNGTKQQGNVRGNLIGTMGDVKFFSLLEPSQPMIIHYAKTGGNILVRYNESALPDLITRLEALNLELFGQSELSISHLDEHIAAMYDRESRDASLITAAAVLALLLTVTGLLGMVMFTLEKRTKEIGIRKVLGAGIAQIIWLLTRQYAGLILMGCVLGIPVAHWLLQDWLAHFAFVAESSFTPYAIAVLSILAGSWLIISVQASRAASINPVETLRSE